MPGSMSFSCETGRMMFAPFTVCCFIRFEFFVGELAGLFQHAVVDADLADVVQQRRDAQAVEIFGAQAEPVADDDRIFRHAPGMAARVRVLFVDGRGEHANRAEEELAILVPRPP